MKTKSKLSAYILRSSTTALLFSCVIVALCSAIHVPEQGPKALPPQDNTAFGTNAHQSRTLSFAERVAYQRAIEGVYWRHRIWPKERPDPKPSLDAVMSQAQLERKVTDYLGNSHELEEYWQQPITPNQLQAEMDRIAHHTQRPEVLRELFEALGNDPFVVAECLARPVLTERLLVGFAASKQIEQTHRIYSQPVADAAHYILPSIYDAPTGCTPDTWTATSTANAPAARTHHTAVWTGSEMIVWGGNVSPLNTGGRYNPTTDSWAPTNTMNAPSARYAHTAVWTGTEMIIWGGVFSSPPPNSGGRYNPSTDSWTATSTTDAPTGRSAHTAVWTGNEMIVWGGYNGSELNSGGRYNPDTDSWRATNTANAPTLRYGHTAVWTGGEMIVWGGYDGVNLLNTGGRYNPSTDSWIPTSTDNAPTVRNNHTGVWTDNEMIIWGGNDNTQDFNTGGRYNPGTNSWTPTNTSNAPTARAGHTAVWTNSEMIVWGGIGVSRFNTGGRYDPDRDSWTATSTTDAPTARVFHTAVWTNNEMIIWGGDATPMIFNTGGRYCVQSGPTHPAFFSGEVSLGNGIYYLQFPNSTPFGYYAYLSDPHFIYHFDMGYEYWFDANDGHSGLYLYDFAANTFFYTSPSFPFPYLYDFGLNTVLYYYPDTQRPGHYTTNPRYFYNFATHQIITR